MGEVIQLQGDQRKDVQEFLVDKKEGLELDAKTIKVDNHPSTRTIRDLNWRYELFTDQIALGPRLLRSPSAATSRPPDAPAQRTYRS